MILLKDSDQIRLPQQEPGPLQPDAEASCPQQVVSVGPGMAWGVRPVRLLVGEIIFSVFVLPHDGHASGAGLPNFNTSP